MLDKQRNRLIEGKTEFENALFDSLLQNVLQHLIPGRFQKLWRFDDVHERLRLRDHHSVPGIQQVEIDKIVGSVGRAEAFTRSFLPKNWRLRNRWSRVYAAAISTREMPPVELYRIGESYFVVDGNHRVSVMRQMGIVSVEAEVIEWESPVNLSPDTRLTMQVARVVPQASSEQPLETPEARS